MIKYTYRTDARGVVLVTRPGEPEHALTLGLKAAARMDLVIARWEPLSTKHEARTGVHRSRILSTIERESGGNPGARNPEKRSDPTDDGIGLMQLTFKYFNHGHSIVALFEPDLNIGIGTDYLAQLSKRYENAGPDWPKVSAAYNHGHVEESDANPFGMVSTTNHIEEEVAASNYYLLRGAPPDVLVREIPDEEVLAQGAALLAEVARSEDFGPHGDAERDTDPDGMPIKGGSHAS